MVFPCMEGNRPDDLWESRMQADRSVVNLDEETAAVTPSATVRRGFGPAYIVAISVPGSAYS